MTQRDIVERILRARVYDVAQETPLDPAPGLSARLGARVWLKREDLQPVFSFKLRGAYNRIAALRPHDAARGIFAASAGNHAQGVALAAARRGFRATIAMPRTTPEIKVRAVSALGAEVVLHGDSYDEAHAEARRREQRAGGVFVHPYDDLDVIAGQGTIAVEILRQHPDPIDAVFVPVGGGGLLAGVLSYLKFLRPETAVIAVEPDDAACLAAALRAGRPVPLDHVGIFADGAAVREVGAHPFALVRDRLDGVVAVNVDEICAAILDLFEDTRVVAEPAGALAVAGMKKWLADKPSPARSELQVSRSEPKASEDQSGEPSEDREGWPSEVQRSCVAIVSGANIDFHRLRHISERAELGEQREAIFAVTIPERPGSFRQLCAAIGDRSITEFNYRYADPHEAQVFVGVELRRGVEERREIAAALRARGHRVVDMTGNELAVLHTRHMVGGRVPAALRGERVLRFEFPERPGALGRFLDLMSPGWNLTLFHYRNHGGAVGRVLAGIEVPAAESDAFARYLGELGYPWVDETDNAAYRLFLR